MPCGRLLESIPKGGLDNRIHRRVHRSQFVPLEKGPLSELFSEFRDEFIGKRGRDHFNT